MSEAFKLVHVNIADAPSTAWPLPTEGMPGLEGVRIVQVAMMLAFGFNHSPGWFGVLAWSLAKAHAALGPEEAELNGADSYGGGGPHVDDYMFLVPDLGARAPMSYEAYVQLAETGAGKGAINRAKDAVEGQPRTVFKPTGRIMDLSGVAAGGPLEGTLSSPREKVEKFADLLMAGGFAHMHLRRVTLKELTTVVGLAV